MSHRNSHLGRLGFVAVITLVALLSGCAEIKPWERDLLADKYMALQATPLDSSLDAHIYNSKEAASGGQGVGGGGCGCN